MNWLTQELDVDFVFSLSFGFYYSAVAYNCVYIRVVRHFQNTFMFKKKIFYVIPFFLFAAILTSCKDSGLTLSKPKDEEQIKNIINLLYSSFSFKPGQEPNWNTIRDISLKGAVFVSEPSPKIERGGIDVEEFISDYKNAIANSSLEKTGYQETIINTKIWQSGTVANVEVSFKASTASDAGQRKPGLDNIQLLNDSGKWKIVAFTTQSESKL